MRYRVIHVIGTMEVGGGAGHLLALVPALRREGFDVEVLTGVMGRTGRRMQDAGVPVTVLGPLSSSALPRLVRRFRRQHPDLIHLHGSRAGFLGSVAAWVARTPAPLIYTAHAFSFKRVLPGPLRWGATVAERVTGRLVDTIICVALADARAAAARGIVAKHVEVIPNGIDLFALTAEARNDVQHDGHSEALVIGMIARLVPDKDPLTFVRAAAGVAVRRPAARFLVVGDGPLRREVEAESRRLGLSDRLRVTGFRDDVPALLVGMDIIVLPSRWEGLPLAVLEAMALGKPVVCSRLPTLQEILDDGRAGVLVPPGDPWALADVLVELADDPTRRAALGRAARDRVLEAYTVDRMVVRTLGVYRRALAHRGSNAGSGEHAERGWEVGGARLLTNPGGRAGIPSDGGPHA
ncbi:MAG: glycosyltransferase [Armatimonadota bacterium]|nr:glycosyltransferase [Armatimonadota bacterium]MDR7400608.1 glycosyltransferase [Armatimonadota bacterium]MDR7403136.1 glycosyltransferase [Armatimonadota bacterium]MDR7517238.1 glycosyltransferase [Armatimonadota bacterium]MDR7559795.1 glycosyltransferase [Armatimonadota bacterium]